MNEEPKPVKDDVNKDKPEDAMYRVVDHVVIKDRNTGKSIINIRG